MIIRDIFNTNMLDEDIQRELLRYTADPERALSIAVSIEIGHQTQQLISSNNNNSIAILSIHQFSQFRGANARTNQSSRSIFNRAAIGLLEAVDEIGQLIARFALHWLKNIIIVVFSIILQMYVGKK